MTESDSTEKERADAQRDVLFQARRRGLVALGATVVVGIVGIATLRYCIDDVASGVACKTDSDCDGVIGVECLHAPTSTYCTHSCYRNDDCAPGFHCESPPWEKGTTRLLCLKDIAPPSK